MADGAERHSAQRSLAEIHGTIEPPPPGSGFWRTLARYSGPGALVAVGYMDPGNWITSIGGGSQYGYLLLSVIAMSSLVAMLLQYMSAKLGIVTGRDLAQITREHTNRLGAIVLWVIAELAIIATEIAEVIGGAIALHLLFGIPLLAGVLITVADVLLLLLLLRIGFRTIEALVAVLILTILTIFGYQVALADPNIAEMLAGFVPQPEVLHPGQLTLALGIIGATVMPHNLYLHSAIVQSRRVDRADRSQLRRAVRYASWDSHVQLGIAFVVNCLLLLLGAALFYGTSEDLGTFTALYHALQNPEIVGAIASPVLATLFAVALLASGQNSTITGTLSGQVVMEGFLRVRVSPWVRRVVSRGIAVIPVLAVTITSHGDERFLEELLISSQVFLCIALPVSMVPLVWFTSSKRIMGAEFANPRWAMLTAWCVAAVLTVLNLQLAVQILAGG